jgi:hypothetical protein
MQYGVYGPFPIPAGRPRFIEKRARDDVFDQAESACRGLSQAHGCYIFSMRAGRGYRPWYVGKACGKGGFRGECFQAHKLQHYNSVVTKTRRGTPVLHLIARSTRSGKLSFRNAGQEIEWLERMLIGLALRENPELLNRKDTKYLKDLVVPGILGRPGKPGSFNGATDTLRVSLGLRGG